MLRLFRSACAAIVVLGSCIALIAAPATVSSASAAPAVRHSGSVRVSCDLKLKKQSSAGHFDVYACDKTGAALVSHVATELEALWPKMTKAEPNGMGPPEGWAGGKGKPLDVLLVPPSTNACVNATSCTPPYNIGTNLGEESGAKLLLINERPDSTLDLDAVLCHEFFHALEDTLAPGGAAGTWFGEASATWAETVYVPAAKDAAGFFQDFQKQETSLNSTAGNHEYGAFLWLLWLTQEVGHDATGAAGRQAVFQLWKDLKGATTGAAVDAVINKHYPWDTWFPKFAFEDLNLVSFKPDVTPYLFDEAYPFVPLAAPQPLIKKPLQPGTDDNIAVHMPPLSSLSMFMVPIGSTVKHIYLDFTTLPDGADAWVIAKINGKTQVIDSTGAAQEFCRDEPDGNVTNLAVVITDHDPEAIVQGSFEVATDANCAKPIPCASLLTSSDMPYHVFQESALPLDEFGIKGDVCEFLGLDSQDNPLVTADGAFPMPSLKVAQQGMAIDQKRFNLKPVKGVGNQALTGCLGEGSSGCEIMGTIVRQGAVLAVVDTNTSQVNTVALAKEIVAKIKAG